MTKSWHHFAWRFYGWNNCLIWICYFSDLTSILQFKKNAPNMADSTGMKHSVSSLNEYLKRLRVKVFSSLNFIKSTFAVMFPFCNKKNVGVIKFHHKVNARKDILCIVIFRGLLRLVSLTSRQYLITRFWVLALPRSHCVESLSKSLNQLRSQGLPGPKWGKNEKILREIKV